MHSPHMQQKLLLGSCLRPTTSGRSCGGSRDRHARLAFREQTSSVLVSEPGKLSCSGAIGSAMQDGLLRDGCCLTGSLEYSHPTPTCGSASNMQGWPHAKPLQLQVLCSKSSSAANMLCSPCVEGPLKRLCWLIRSSGIRAPAYASGRRTLLCLRRSRLCLQCTPGVSMSTDLQLRYHRTSAGYPMLTSHAACHTIHSRQGMLDAQLLT